MSAAGSNYGVWGLVVIDSIIFIGFAYSFFKPVNLRDWRSFGAYSAFVVALFAEMYGSPLTIYLLSGWLGSNFPDANLFGHDAGHLWWLLTLGMLPVLVVMYVRLAISEERDAEKAFGEAWRAYATVTPRFIPTFTKDGGVPRVSSH